MAIWQLADAENLSIRLAKVSMMMMRSMSEMGLATSKCSQVLAPPELPVNCASQSLELVPSGMSEKCVQVLELKLLVVMFVAPWNRLRSHYLKRLASCKRQSLSEDAMGDWA
jgi:hypothetical protein